MSADAKKIKETARYMGLRGQPDSRMAALIEACLAEVEAAAVPRSVTLELPLSTKSDCCRLGAGALSLTSRHLARRLEGCAEAVVMAVTLGIGPDRLISRRERLDSAEALCLQAAAAALVEEVCEGVCRDIEAQAAPRGLTARARFSPGYGDLDISCQTGVLRILDAAKRIGLAETASHMLVPLKSVTAIVGLSRGGPRPKPPAACAGCEREGCAFRAENDA
jgi:5-methyltetrahydrofolate--homocysteine methyltransferase